MAVVLDASVATAWCLRDEVGTGQADQVIKRLFDEPGIVPGIFWHEMRNALVIAERRGRIDADEVAQHLTRLRVLPLLTDDDQNDLQTVALARRRALTAYDAAYLETAKRRGVALATLDRKMAAAASAEGVAGRAG